MSFLVRSQGERDTEELVKITVAVSTGLPKKGLV